MTARTLAGAVHFGQVAGQYQRLRQLHPTGRALDFHRYIRDDQGVSFEQFVCKHEFNQPEEWERSYCLYCGLDGDA